MTDHGAVLGVDDLARMAHERLDTGKTASALRLFLRAALMGDDSSMHMAGYIYGGGMGVKRDEKKEIYWYKRAYKRGNPLSAANLGVLALNKRHMLRAIRWFSKAVVLGDISANLQIAVVYLRTQRQKDAFIHLKQILKAKVPIGVSEADVEIARLLLEDADARRKVEAGVVHQRLIDASDSQSHGRTFRT